MKNVIDVKVTNLSTSLPLPKYETEGAAGMDVMACFDCEDGGFSIIKGYDWFNRELIEYQVTPESEVAIAPGERALIPTGLKIEIPSGYEIEVRPRSGLALKKGITILNTPGTIDSDYRGMLGIIIINHSNEVFTISHGDKIAQIVLEEVPQINWKPVEKLTITSRGEGGFGSTSVTIPSNTAENTAVKSGDERTPSFQVGDILDGVGRIKSVKFDKLSGIFIYETELHGDINFMSEQEIIDIVL